MGFVGIAAKGKPVTLVSTDVEGSTELWEWDKKAMDDAQAIHDRIIRSELKKFCGYEVCVCGGGGGHGWGTGDHATHLGSGCRLSGPKEVPAFDVVAFFCRSGGETGHGALICPHVLS